MALYALGHITRCGPSLFEKGISGLPSKSSIDRDSKGLSVSVCSFAPLMIVAYIRIICIYDGYLGLWIACLVGSILVELRGHSGVLKPRGL